MAHVRRLHLTKKAMKKRYRLCGGVVMGDVLPGPTGRYSAILGCMVCILVSTVLLCVSSAHSQVIEEGGFPVKGDGVSGEPFSLSCPPRLYVEAGESVLFSCSATAVPEEGVRYEWESLSGDGFHLLSASDELSPLFTAPLSGEGAEYVYRLTAMSVGVYETATVTVAVEGFPGDIVQDRSKSPVAQEDCGSFGGLGRDQEGCQPWEKTPPRDFFGDSPEDEGIVPWPSFPESPAAEDKEFAGSSGAGPFPQTPPRLECPVAVFLEELETGAIECHVSDASGEEFLEYSWEPVGNTTRDYMDNPRLMPEDAPNPSVVAPEAPVYETLESFHSGETTFRYRYRLTVTSRATGLTSSSEVEVFVSSSRPSVYCPLEVVVEEGETIALDCEGVDPLSDRMDYDEEAASILWEWESLWGTSMSLLDATDLSSALFTAPPGSAGEEYHYIASMTSSASGVPRTARRRVTVRVSEAETGAPIASDDIRLDNGQQSLPPELRCPNKEAYEGEMEMEIALECTISENPGELSDWTWAWAPDGSTSLAPLSATNIHNPTFTVRPVNGNKVYYYRITATATFDNIVLINTMRVTVKERPDISVTCGEHDKSVYEDEEGIVLECEASGAPGGDDPENYTWSWAPDTKLSATNVFNPTFNVPKDIPRDTTYLYTVTASADNADDGTAAVTVTVKDLVPVITCNDAEVYEGAVDFMLDCSVTNEPTSPTYSWTGADIANRLNSTTILKPTFAVPDTVYANTDYDYEVTLSADGMDDVTEDVTVTVKKKPAISVTCNEFINHVDEGAGEIELECDASGAPGDNYMWSWLPTTLLKAHDTRMPTFEVPGDVPQDTSYFYTATATADNAQAGQAHVTVTVRDTDSADPVITCNDAEVYEATADFTLDCSVTNEPSGATYRWTGTDISHRLSGADGLTPTFSVPGDIDEPDEANKDYDYTVKMMVGSVEQASEDVTVTVLEKPNIWCRRIYAPNANPGDTFAIYTYEGLGNVLIEYCTWTLDGLESVEYTFAWTVWNDGSEADLALLSATDDDPVYFAIPPVVTTTEMYYYQLTVSADNADPVVIKYLIVVRVSSADRLDLDCSDPDPVYEGSGEITLDCSVTNEPSGAMYAWVARGGTSDTDYLTNTDSLRATFSVPDNVDADTNYDYTVTLSASGINDVTEDVTVTVKNKPQIILDCGNGPGSPLAVGIGDRDSYGFSCSASGAPEGSSYTYEWTARDPTPNTDLLSATDMSSTQFNARDISVPHMDFHYRVTATADNAEEGSLDIRIRVRDMDAQPPVVTCNNPDPVYEGSDDIVLDCTVANEPSGATYAWVARGSTSDTDDLTNTDSLRATFSVPSDIDELNGADKAYEYTVTLSAGGADVASADITVTVLEKPDITCRIESYNGPGSITYYQEGGGTFRLPTCPENDLLPARIPRSNFIYSWTGTSDIDLLSATNVHSPTFNIPENLSSSKEYVYRLQVSAPGENVDPRNRVFQIRISDRPDITVTCEGNPYNVNEGDNDITLDCSASGAPPGSSYTYAWTARGSTSNTDKLSDTVIASPDFAVPTAVDGNETYEYLLTVSAERADPATAEVTVRVLNKGSLSVVCTDIFREVYEGSDDFDLDCVASGAPAGSGYTYEWTARGSTSDTALLSATDVSSPFFYVPDAVSGDETHEYTLTVSAENTDPATAEVTVTVLKKESLSLVCTDPDPVYEGSDDFALDCVASGAPESSYYEYVWTARGSTSDTALLSARNVSSPLFYVPDVVSSDETYAYRLTVSAENAEDATAEVTVTVLNKESLSLVCTDPDPVYEGSDDFALDCVASGAPAGSGYEYEWTARGSTSDTALLSATDVSSPLFYVPDAVSSDETYEYRLTVSAENADPSSADVTVKVLNKGALSVVCATPSSVYEGSADFALDCVASGASAGSAYEYEWTARDSTANTDLLIAGTDGPTPTFAVPDEVDKDETYEYLLTVSAANAEDAKAEVTVKVLNRGALSVACASPPLVYEGSAEFALDCSASGAAAGPSYTYAWSARGSTANTDLLISGTDGLTPTFAVPDEVDETTRYEYLLTVSAENAEDAKAEVTVTVLNRGALAVVCTETHEVYEGAQNFAFDCTASGAPAGSDYSYAWTARGSTANTNLLISGADGPTPTFAVPDEVEGDETHEYLLTVSAANAEDAKAEVTVTVLNRGALALVCTSSYEVYEGVEDFSFDCEVSGAPAGSSYTYAWSARGSTANTDLLISGTDGPTPMFDVPSEVDEATTYEYLLTVSAANAEDAKAEVTVTVLNRGALALVCTSSYEVYEGAEDFSFDCSASGAPAGVEYTYAWTTRGATPNTNLLSDPSVASPVFRVPDQVSSDRTFRYLLTVSAANVESVSAEVTVTVLNSGVLALVCTQTHEVYEGAEDFALVCAASGAPGDNPQYTYVWVAGGDTPDTSLLSAADIASPVFYVPDEVEEDETYEYTLTVSADNAEDAVAEVSVTVLDRVQTPPSEPVSPPVDSPPPLASSSSTREPSDPSALGVTISVSSLRFGVQSADTEVSLDPMTDGISTRLAGPYHAGRMTLSLDGSDEVRENGEMDLSIELASPVTLQRKGGVEASSIVLSPGWSLAESCEQLSSQTIGSLYTETTLSDGDCRLLRFGGELDLTDVPSGRYAGSMDIILRSGESEEAYSVEVDVTVIPAQRVITIGPGGVRFSTSRELPAGLTEEQNLSIYPHVAFLTEGKPNGVFELSNPSLIPLEVSVSARFGYTEATENGREVVVENTSGSPLGDLSSVVDIHPGVLVLQPGEKGLVRYGVKEGVLSDMDERGYAAFFDVVSEPRQYVRSDQMPEEVSGDRTARVTMRIPGVYVPGEGASQLRAALLSISYVGSLSATFLLETQDHPFMGGVLAYDGEGRELGRRETLVYTRSRVRISLDRVPEGGAVFLRFAPRGSGRVPEPASIQWDAPRRDIGAADRDRTRPPATLVQKP